MKIEFNPQKNISLLQHGRRFFVWDSFFIRLSNIWNAVPCDIKAETTLSSFKAKLKSFYFVRLYQIFDGDNVRTFKLICPKCRKVNIFSVCSC